MKLAKLLVLYTTLSLSGCMQVPLQQSLSPLQASQLEKIYSVDVKPKFISFVVKSHGCTHQKHFKLVQQSVGKNREFALLRLKKDRCRAMPRAFPVTFRLDQEYQAEQAVEVVNPRFEKPLAKKRPAK